MNMVSFNKSKEPTIKIKMADINAIDFIQFINIVLLSFFLFHSIRLRYLQSQSYFHAAKFSFLFPQMIVNSRWPPYKGLNMP